MKWILASLITFAAMNSFAQAPEIVAQIGKKGITLDEFNKRYNEVKSQTINPPTKTEFLEDLIRYEVGLQEAEKKNLINDPIVQDRIKQETYKALLEKELSAKINAIQVNDKEMMAWYKTHPEIRSSHILIEYKQGATPAQVAEAKKRATEIFQEVKASKRPFEELVKLYSDDSITKALGGDIGFQTRVTLVPNYYQALSEMKVGEVRGLIETQFGFHIVKLTAKKDYASANKQQIRASVFDEKRRTVFDDYFKSLKKSYTIKENPTLLK